MPTTYTHYRFGQEVRAALPHNLQETIETYIDLFNIGLHGPDLLFYYKPFFWKNQVIACGRALHKNAGMQFVKHTENIFRLHGDTAHLVYVYGFLCHFALDRACHGYINAYQKKNGVSHGEIEKEFDRRLLVHDGHHPLKTVRTTHIHVDKEAARVVADFYPQVSARQIQSAARQFCFYDRLLVMPGRQLRRTAKVVLSLNSNAKRYNLFMNEKPNPACSESNAQLLRLYRQGKKEAVMLIEEYVDSLLGLCRWNALYRCNFHSERVCNKP